MNYTGSSPTLNFDCPATLSAAYNLDGYVALRRAIDPTLISSLGEWFEDRIGQFATENGMERSEYLSVINKWPHWNSAVMDIMWSIAGKLRQQVALVMNASVVLPVGAVIFRKSNSLPGIQHGDEMPGIVSPLRVTAPTHAHQDLAYARFPGSQLFQATSWVPLVLKHADTLSFEKGSHRLGLQDVRDFLMDPGASQVAGVAIFSVYRIS